MNSTMNHVFLSLAELVALVQWSPEQNVHNTEYLKSDFKLIVNKVLFGHTPINRAFQGKGKMHGIWGTVNQGTVNRGFTIITASHHQTYKLRLHFNYYTRLTYQ